MAKYRDRRICVRLTQEEYEEALRLAAKVKRYFMTVGTVSALVQKLLADAIKADHAEMDAQSKAINEAKAKGRKLLGAGPPLSDKAR